MRRITLSLVMNAKMKTKGRILYARYPITINKLPVVTPQIQNTAARKIIAFLHSKIQLIGIMQIVQILINKCAKYDIIILEKAKNRILYLLLNQTSE